MAPQPLDAHTDDTALSGETAEGIGGDEAAQSTRPSQRGISRLFVWRPAPAVGSNPLDAFPSEGPIPLDGDTAPRPRRTRGIVLSLVSAIAMLEAGALMWQWYGPFGALPVPPSGWENLATQQPAGAPALIAGVRRGVTESAGPRDVVELPSGSQNPSMPVDVKDRAIVVPQVDLKARAAQGKALEVSGQPAAAARSIETTTRSISPAGTTDSGSVLIAGWVAISSPEVMQLFEGGKLLGTTELEQILVPAGRHQFELISEALDYRDTRTIEVEGGRTATLRLELPPGTIDVNAVPWAEVWIDGQRVDETPIGKFPIRIGTHEIVFRHPDLGERRQTVVVKHGTPARVSVDLTK